MTIRLEERKGRGLVIDIIIRLPSGYLHRERRKAPMQDRIYAMRWALQREKYLLLHGCDANRRDWPVKPAVAKLYHVTNQVEGWIYFIEGPGGAIKIGWTMDVETRLLELQTGSPDALRVLGRMRGSFKAEREMHFRFRHVHIRGEWFRPSDDLLAFVNTLSIPGARVEQKSNPG